MIRTALYDGPMHAPTSLPSRPLASWMCRGFLLIFVTTLTLPLYAQGPPSPAPGPADAESQALMAEFQQGQQRLGQLQVQAIREDAGLEERRTAIDTMLVDAMVEIDPNTRSNIARFNEVSQAAMAAQQAQDQAAVQSLMSEAMELQVELQAAQAEAIERDDIQEAIQSFEDDLMSAVLAIDPEAGALRARLDELEEALGLGGG